MLIFRSRHVNVGKKMDYMNNLTDIVLLTIDTGVYAMFFDLGNSRNHTRKRVDMEDLLLSMELTNHYPTVIYSIIPSMYNLCGSRKFVAWNGNEEQDERTSHNIHEIEYELYTLSKLGGGVITQLGSHRDKRLGLEACIKSINRMSYKLGYNLILINSLDQHFNIGITLDDLKYVKDRLDKDVVPYVDIGIHLAYLYVNGIYNLSDPNEVSRFFTDFNRLFSNKFTFKVVFLTDCSTDFGSKDYESERVGIGQIWNSDSLHTLLCECQERNITILTEYHTDMELVYELTNEINNYYKE